MKNKKSQTAEPKCDSCKKQIMVAFSSQKGTYNYCGECAGKIKRFERIMYGGTFKDFDSLKAKEALSVLREVMANLLDEEEKIKQRLVDVGIIVDEFASE